MFAQLLTENVIPMLISQQFDVIRLKPDSKNSGHSGNGRSERLVDRWQIISAQLLGLLLNGGECGHNVLLEQLDLH